MRARIVLLATAAALVAVALSMNVASAGRLGPATTSAKAYPAPKVPNAAALKKQYGGQSITFIGDSVGGSHNRDVALAKQFTKDTGIKVKVVPHPAASDASYSQLARVFSSKSSSFDVAMIDVVMAYLAQQFTEHLMTGRVGGGFGEEAFGGEAGEGINLQQIGPVLLVEHDVDVRQRGGAGDRVAAEGRQVLTGLE